MATTPELQDALNRRLHQMNSANHIPREPPMNGVHDSEGRARWIRMPMGPMKAKPQRDWSPESEGDLLQQPQKVSDSSSSRNKLDVNPGRSRSSDTYNDGARPKVPALVLNMHHSSALEQMRAQPSEPMKHKCSVELRSEQTAGVANPKSCVTHSSIGMATPRPSGEYSDGEEYSEGAEDTDEPLEYAMLEVANLLPDGKAGEFLDMMQRQGQKQEHKHQRMRRSLREARAEVRRSRTSSEISGADSIKLQTRKPSRMETSENSQALTTPSESSSGHLQNIERKTGEELPKIHALRQSSMNPEPHEDDKRSNKNGCTSQSSIRHECRSQVGDEAFNTSECLASYQEAANDGPNSQRGIAGSRECTSGSQEEDWSAFQTPRTFSIPQESHAAAKSQEETQSALGRDSQGQIPNSDVDSKSARRTSWVRMFTFQIALLAIWIRLFPPHWLDTSSMHIGTFPLGTPSQTSQEFPKVFSWEWPFPFQFRKSQATDSGQTFHEAPRGTSWPRPSASQAGQQDMQSPGSPGQGVSTGSDETWEAPRGTSWPWSSGSHRAEPGMQSPGSPGQGMSPPVSAERFAAAAARIQAYEAEGGIALLPMQPQPALPLPEMQQMQQQQVLQMQQMQSHMQQLQQIQRHLLEQPAQHPQEPPPQQPQQQKHHQTQPEAEAQQEQQARQPPGSEAGPGNGPLDPSAAMSRFLLQAGLTEDRAKWIARKLLHEQLDTSLLLRVSSEERASVLASPEFGLQVGERLRILAALRETASPT